MFLLTCVSALVDVIDRSTVKELWETPANILTVLQPKKDVQSFGAHV